jgi:hypothetical protein
MISGRSQPVCRPAWLAGLLVLLLAATLSAGAPSAPPLTIMPFQTATFVRDPVAAAELSEFSEFSARLLYWTDTPRDPIVLAGRVLKSSLLPFIDEWRGARPPGTAAAGGMVRTRVSEAYRWLAGPRLGRIVIAAEPTIIPPVRTDFFAGGTAEVPWVLENRRDIPMQVAFSLPGAASPIFTATLAAGQTRGLFLAIPAPAADVAVLIATVDGRAHSFQFPLRRHPRGSLEVDVLDESGRPTPARVYLTGADGRAHAPEGTMHRIVSGEFGQPFAGDAYFYTAGRIDVAVPAGEVVLEIIKGLEYQPVLLTLPVAADRPARATVRLERSAHLKAEGWYSGDVHVHANLFAQTLITPRDILLVAQAEDLNVVNLLPCNDPRTTTITDRQYFTGRPDAVSTPDRILYFNEEMRNDIYGHVGFLNLKTFVEPAYFGWPNSPFPFDHPGNFPQAAAAKAQGAAVVYVHPALPSEFPVDVALGLADTIDVMSQNAEDLPTEYWYRLLNCGFRCPVSAGTDSFLNIPLHIIAGAGRVYVQTGDTFDYQRWIDGFQAGRSFATNGPLLRFTVNGQGPGADIRSDGPIEVEVSGQARSIVPMEALELIVNGRAVRRWAADQDPRTVSFSDKITLDRSSWVALRVRAGGHRLAPNDREVYAHTSPVYVSVANRRVASRADAEFFIKQIDVLIAKMDSRGNFEHPGQRDGIVARFREAQEIYRRIAEDDQARL